MYRYGGLKTQAITVQYENICTTTVNQMEAIWNDLWLKEVNPCIFNV